MTTFERLESLFEMYFQEPDQQKESNIKQLIEFEIRNIENNAILKKLEDERTLRQTRRA